jgi:transcriptional regulator with XRE-family HTH domain
LTQTQLGALVGVSHSAIVGWERETWQPRSGHRQALLAALGPFDRDPGIDATAAMTEAVAALLRKAEL